MKVVHRIGLRASGAQRRELESLGVNVPAGIALPGGEVPLIAFDVDEEHPNWSTLRSLLEKWKASDMPRTEFSSNEIEQSAWLDLVSDWHCGYPQPDELSFGYLRATYDLRNFCDRCGIGKIQNAPFQMKGEPKWGKKAMLQLNWVFDEYFVTPEVWRNAFSPHGVECRAVLNTAGRELKTVVQLVVHQEVGIVTDGLVSEEPACSRCGRRKFAPVTRGPFPPPTSRPTAAIVKTKEYFGSGASARKGVLVSQAVGRALLAGKIRGVSFRPCAERNVT